MQHNKKRKEKVIQQYQLYYCRITAYPLLNNKVNKLFLPFFLPFLSTIISQQFIYLIFFFAVLVYPLFKRTVFACLTVMRFFFNFLGIYMHGVD